MQRTAGLIIRALHSMRARYSRASAMQEHALEKTFKSRAYILRTHDDLARCSGIGFLSAFSFIPLSNEEGN